MAHWLTEMREKAGYSTIRSLADDSGVDVSTLSRIEKEDGPQPTTSTLKKLAPFLKVPYIKLLAMAGHLGRDPDSQKLAALYEKNPSLSFIDDIPGDLLNSQNMSSTSVFQEMNTAYMRVAKDAQENGISPEEFQKAVDFIVWSKKRNG